MRVEPFAETRSGRSIARMALLAIGLTFVLVATACSEGLSASGPRTELTADEVSDWLGRAAEVGLPCEESSALAGDALEAEEASNENAGTSMPIVAAAGQAIEECLALLDPDADHRWEGLRADWPEAGAAFRARVEALLAVDEAALLAAATNLDNRTLVGRLYDAARAADGSADDLEALVRSTAASVGLEIPAGETLYRWTPPNH